MRFPLGLRKIALASMPLFALLFMTIGSASTAHAAVVLDTTITVSGCETDTCVGTICFTAQEHLVLRTEGANKCGIHIDLHGTATGPGGEQYEVSATENIQGACEAPGCQSAVVNVHIIGKGKTANLVIHQQQIVCSSPPSITEKNTFITCH